MNKSACCDAVVIAEHGGEGTSFYRCAKCSNPCDVKPVETTHTENPEAVSELALCATEDLIKELTKRADCGIVGLIKPARENGKAVYKLKWFGDPFAAAGLCTAIQDEVNFQRREAEDHIEPEQF